MDILLIVRGLAAISVVIWHTVGYQNEFPAVINIPGRTAVWLFFGMSGYVIAYGFIHGRYSLSLGDLRDFYTNRFLRIYPIFVVLSAISWITEWLLSGLNPLSLQDLPAQLFALQFNHDYSLNGVFWTLGIEIQFYFLAPLLVMPILKSMGRKPLLFGIYFLLVILNIYVIQRVGWWTFDGRNVISNLSHFFIGMVACKIVFGLKPSALRFGISILSVCALLMLTSWLYHRAPVLYWTIGALLVDLVIFLIILAHASCEWRNFGVHRMYLIFAFLGTLSYGVYAWHAYFMKYIPQISDNPVAVIAISLIAAYLTWRFIESPALRLKRERGHSPIESVIK